jgi:putative transposase
LGVYIQFHSTNISGVEVVAFLHGLLRHLPGSVVVIWDGGPIHYRHLVQDYVRRRRARLHVYRFPAYAPELNPAEQLWTNGKRDMSNGTPEDIEELAGQVRLAIQRVARSQRLLRACVEKSGLSF